ncbi:amphi-Trp domain-containing protein [Halobacterium sp. R2-5]|uniref:amphi-Trp domain-containing protein n=1 Tax=Halobacterium sp. R2-5 TaxID=2715751 RepID=UPI0014219EAB|nr:amphi-Trp domain-containing protein [Halobacterium sp. R2-5]NIB98756.1 amphi-Trp domain-containing protein [Halobacterium sp. R2-5]
MPEEVIFESESDRSREEIAAYLRTVADNLESGEGITLKSDGDSLSLDPPTHSTFEVKAEREGPEGGPKELSVEFELEWPEDGETESESGELEIE